MATKSVICTAIQILGILKNCPTRPAWGLSKILHLLYIEWSTEWLHMWMKLTEWGCFKVPVNPGKRYTSPSPVQYWCILKCIFQCENADRSWWTWSALWLINICILLLSLWVLSLHSCHVKFYSKSHHNTKSSWWLLLPCQQSTKLYMCLCWTRVFSCY